MGSMRTRALGGVDFAADIGERWFEDYVVGAVYEYGYLEVSEAEILEFARRFDPQPIHVDPAFAAGGPFGGLIGSGWHSAGLAMRLLADHYLSRVASLGLAGSGRAALAGPAPPRRHRPAAYDDHRDPPVRSKPDRGVVVTDTSDQPARRPPDHLPCRRSSSSVDLAEARAEPRPLVAAGRLEHLVGLWIVTTDGPAELLAMIRPAGRRSTAGPVAVAESGVPDLLRTGCTSDPPLVHRVVVPTGYAPSGQVERRSDERSASRRHPGLQHRSRRGRRRRRSATSFAWRTSTPTFRRRRRRSKRPAQRIGEDEANSWLPFTGRDDLKEAVAALHRAARRSSLRRPPGDRHHAAARARRCSTRCSA